MHTAYALTADYAGTVEVDGAEVPKFAGGLLAVGDGDFDVAHELAAGDGVIVVSDADSSLAALLDAYAALERVDVPEGATPVSPYKRRTDEALQHDAVRRDLEVDGLERADVIAVLEQHDDDQRAAVAELVEGTAGGTIPADLQNAGIGAVPTTPVWTLPDVGEILDRETLDTLERTQLDEIAASRDVTVEQGTGAGGNVVKGDVVEAIINAQVNAAMLAERRAELAGKTSDELVEIAAGEGLSVVGTGTDGDVTDDDLIAAILKNWEH